MNLGPGIDCQFLEWFEGPFLSCCVFRPAVASIRMVENDGKHSKIMKKVPLSSCVREAHVRLVKKNFMILECFSSFSTMRMHAQACVCMFKIHNTLHTIFPGKCYKFEQHLAKMFHSLLQLYFVAKLIM